MLHVGEQEVSLVQATHNPRAMLEWAARLCYDSVDKTHCNQCSDGTCPDCTDRGQKFLSNLLKRGHESIFEHASATFYIITDRGVSHEIVRHRLASYSQQSTRYVKFEDGITVIPPVDSKTFNDESDSWDMWLRGVNASLTAYKQMCESGEPPQVCRDVLPTCLLTKLCMTANFREWRHFIKLRAAPAAHPKIQYVAKEIFHNLRQILPEYFTNDLIGD